MAVSASAPPGDDEKSPELEDDNPEMTSIMDADQRRELQKAARAEAARMNQPAKEKEPERVTARPPAEAAALAADERLQIPKAAAVPAEALPKTPVPPPQAVEKQVAGPSTWMVVAFVLLAAAVVFALRS